MKWIVPCIVIVLVGPAWGQETILADIDRAALAWDAPTTGGTPTTYHVKCGPTTGEYQELIALAHPTTTAPLKDFIPSEGHYFCVVTASNTFGESGPSNEVIFEAGHRPGSAENVRVVIQ